MVLAVAASGVVATAGGCGDDGGAGGSAGAGRDPLADRLVAVLEADGDAVDGDLDGAEVTCPDVDGDEADPGDRVTCVVELDGAGGGEGEGRRVEVDVEFAADGSITVVGVVPG